jgi:ribosomal protein L7Ae-like RNA K-turn-binding protein
VVIANHVDPIELSFSYQLCRKMGVPYVIVTVRGKLVSGLSFERRLRLCGRYLLSNL